MNLKNVKFTTFTAWCYAYARYAVVRCPSVCSSCSCILSKRVNISVKIFHHLVDPPFLVFLYGNIPTGTVLGGLRLWSFGSMTTAASSVINISISTME